MNHTISHSSRIVSLIAGMTIASLLLAGCGNSSEEAGSDSGSDTQSVAMGLEPWLGYGPWYIAQEKGYFEEEGIDVKITSFDADADLNAALASDQIQVGNIASHTTMNFIDNGIDLSVLLLLDASETADAILSNGEIGSVSELKGKQVAYEEGTTSDLLLNFALKENGMTIDDIEKVSMNADAAGTALIAGKVPSAVTYEPYISEAQKKEPNITPIFTASEKEGLISDVLVAKKDFVNSNSDTIQALVNVWGKAIEFYNSNEDEGQEIIAKAVGSSKEDLETAFDGVKYFDLESNKDQLTGDFLTSTLPAVNQAAMDAGLVSKTIDPTSYVDSTFVEKANE